jgi:hypothetical protein
MTEKSYYIEFRFTPKQRDVRREAILEVPNDLVRRTQTELMNKDRREKAIVLDLAREVALAAFSTAEGACFCRTMKTRFGIMIGFPK